MEILSEHGQEWLERASAGRVSMGILTAGMLIMPLLWALGVAQEGAQNQPQERLICQGEYSTSGKDAHGLTKTINLDEWRMYAMADAAYSVDVRLAAKQAGVEEHYVLTSDLRPKAFALIASSGSEGDKQSIRILCDFGSEELRCRTESNGGSASATLKVKMPYVFMPSTQAPMLDIPWFFQSIASQAERSAGRQTPMPLVSIEDGDTGKGIRLTAQETEHVKYLGREHLKVVGQKVLAHKFEISGSRGRPRDAWLSDSGLLLLAIKEGNPSIVLSSYQGPPL